MSDTPKKPYTCASCGGVLGYLPSDPGFDAERYCCEKCALDGGPSRILVKDQTNMPDDVYEVKGLRYNTDKTRWSLVPSEVMSAIADHYTRGAKKYADDNWRKGLSYNDTYDCAMRHIHAWKMDEEIDPETGSRHLIASIWNLIALVYFQMHRGIYAKFDDRVPNAENTIFMDDPAIKLKRGDIVRVNGQVYMFDSPENPLLTTGDTDDAFQFQSTRVDTDLTGRGPNRRISGDRRKVSDWKWHGETDKDRRQTIGDRRQNEDNLPMVGNRRKNDTEI